MPSPCPVVRQRALQRVGQGLTLTPPTGQLLWGLSQESPVLAQKGPRVLGDTSPRLEEAKAATKEPCQGQRSIAVPCRESCKAQLSLQLLWSPSRTLVYSQWEHRDGGLGTSPGVGQEEQGRTGCT